MQVKVIMQKENENTLANAISQSLEENAKKAYFFIGNFKETGYKIIEEDLIDTKTKLYFAIGIDKRTTTRSMLEGLLNYTDDVYFYSNNNMNEYVSNICVFEYTDRAYMFVSGSNISESGITTDLSLYTKITYDLKNATDKAEYKDQIKMMLKEVEEAEFTKLDKKTILSLVENKEIFSTRQYNHSVMSISELLGKKEKAEEPKKEEAKEVAEDVYKTDVEIPKVDLSGSDISIDIDIPEVEVEDKKDELAIDYVEDKIKIPEGIESYEEYGEEEKTKPEKKEDKIDENNELYDASMANDEVDFSETLDINDMLFSKAEVKLDVKASKTKKKKAEKQEDQVVSSKKINLNNVSNLIFETGAKNAKEEDSIKVPNQVKLMIPDFFGLDEAESEDVNGTLYKVKHISLEIVDAKENKTYKDEDAKIMYKPKQSFLTYVSDMLKNVDYAEEDIIRINKISDKEYVIEVINKKLQEYKVWSKLCNQNFRASTKKFGVM